jgi:hypothetical protein
MRPIGQCSPQRSRCRPPFGLKMQISSAQALRCGLQIVLRSFLNLRSIDFARTKASQHDIQFLCRPRPEGPAAHLQSTVHALNRVSTSLSPE